MADSQDEVHTLIAGLPPCGFSREVPANWQAGIRWTEVWDWGNITCPGCRVAAEKQMKVPRSLKPF